MSNDFPDALVDESQPPKVLPRADHLCALNYHSKSHLPMLLAMSLSCRIAPAVPRATIDVFLVLPINSLLKTTRSTTVVHSQDGGGSCAKCKYLCGKAVNRSKVSGYPLSSDAGTKVDPNHAQTTRAQQPRRSGPKSGQQSNLQRVGQSA